MLSIPKETLCEIPGCTHLATISAQDQLHLFGWGQVADDIVPYGSVHLFCQIHARSPQHFRRENGHQRMRRRCM